MAHRRKARKRGSRYSTIVSMFFWALAIGVLIETKGSIFNPTRSANSTLTQIVGEKPTSPSPIVGGGILPALSTLMQNTWFSLALLGLLVVGGLVVIQSIRVAFKESQELTIQELQGHQEQGLLAVNEAIKLVDDPTSDPRSRIIACYQHLVATVSRLGGRVSSDLTARELDRAVRSTFSLKGDAITHLTQLFEEARYSLHEISGTDASKAREYLESVAEELQVQLEVAP
jgi:Domain of unknown function (DUF4129)